MLLAASQSLKVSPNPSMKQHRYEYTVSFKKKKITNTKFYCKLMIVETF